MRTIKLNFNSTGRYDDVSPFIIADNSLTLKIILPQFNGEFFIVTEINGVKNKKQINPNGEVVLDNLSAGELNAEVKHYLKGELIKVYKIEPLLLKEVDGSLSVMPEMEALNKRVLALEQTLVKEKEEAQKRFDERTKQIRELEENNREFVMTINKLINFAYVDFRDNVYLGGGTREEFEEKFALPMIETNSIKGEENNDED